MTIGSDQVQALVKTRRLLLLANQVEKKRLEPNTETPSFKEFMEGSEPRLAGIPEGKPSTPPLKAKFDQSAEGSVIDTLT